MLGVPISSPSSVTADPGCLMLTDWIPQWSLEAFHGGPSVARGGAGGKGRIKEEEEDSAVNTIILWPFFFVHLMSEF